MAKLLAAGQEPEAAATRRNMPAIRKLVAEHSLQQARLRPVKAQTLQAMVPDNGRTAIVMDIMSAEKRCLAPIASCNARILILGSLPGDASLAAGQYYAHPRNQFWVLMSGIIGQDLLAMRYASRLAILNRAAIALWDVIAQATRAGSLDHGILNVEPNNLRQFVDQMRHLRVIAFNGKKAAAVAGDAFCDSTIDILHLPSSSPANTRNVETKKVQWSALSAYL